LNSIRNDEDYFLRNIVAYEYGTLPVQNTYSLCWVWNHPRWKVCNKIIDVLPILWYSESKP